MGQGINFYPAKSEEFSEEVGVGFKTFLKRFPRAGGKKKEEKEQIWHVGNVYKMYNT